MSDSSTQTDTFVVELYYGNCEEWGDEYYRYKKEKENMEIFIGVVAAGAGALSRPLGILIGIIDFATIFMDDPQMDMTMDMVVKSSRNPTKNHSCVLHITSVYTGKYIYTYQGG